MATDIRQLTTDGRKAYQYWHLMLLLKQRKLEQKMITAGYLPANVQAAADEMPQIAPELEALRELGFPLPEQLPDVHLETNPLRAVRLFFKVNLAFDDAQILTLDVIKQLASSKYQRRSLLRADHKRQAYLQHASERFNAALERLTMDKVYRMALYWTECHGVLASDWQAIAATFVEDPITMPASIPTTAIDDDNPLARLGIQEQAPSEAPEMTANTETSQPTRFAFTDNLFD